MNERIEMTEWVRFNDDGSSDHILVSGDELMRTEHWDRTPYLQVREKNGDPAWPPRPPDCDWLIEVRPVTVQTRDAPSTHQCPND